MSNFIDFSDRIIMMQILLGMFLVGFGIMVMVAWSLHVGFLCWACSFSCFQSAFLTWMLMLQSNQIPKRKSRF